MSTNNQVLAQLLTLDTLVFTPAYGTGGYVERAISEEHTLCKTSDGECVFMLIDSVDDKHTTIVIKGDHSRIKELVKAEIDHFDSDLVWEN